MRIGELARRSALPRDTLRYYERLGLIASVPEGGANSYRDYPEETVLTLEQIADAQAAGLTIAELAVFLGQLDAAEGEDFDGEAFLDARIAEVEARIRRARRFLAALKAARQAIQEPQEPSGT